MILQSGFCALPFSRIFPNIVPNLQKLSLVNQEKMDLAKRVEEYETQVETHFHSRNILQNSRDFPRPVLPLLRFMSTRLPFNFIIFIFIIPNE